MVLQMPAYSTPDATLLIGGTQLQELITAIRDTRNKNRLKPKDTIKLWIQTSEEAYYTQVLAILSRQVNAEQTNFTSEAITGAISIVVGTDKLYIEAAAATIDTEAQKAEMVKEIAYLQGFLISVDKKLGNERFMANAKPDVIESEQKKKNDALAKIKTLEESLANLG